MAVSSTQTTYARGPFFAAVRPLFGRLSQEQVQGLETLLAGLEANPVADVRHHAYPLATTHHETDAKMQPIEEYGRGRGRPYGATRYWGRGYVQLTWDYNYRDMGKRLGVDLLAAPDLAMQPEIAFRIMWVGMTLGTFTGRKLADYFSPTRDQPAQARRIINGMDKAETVARYHAVYVQALTNSKRSKTA